MCILGTIDGGTESSKSAQLSLCSVVGSSILRLHQSAIPQFADRIMQLLLRVVAVSTGASTYEDAWLAIGYICNKLEKSFEPYVRPAMAFTPIYSLTRSPIGPIYYSSLEHWSIKNTRELVYNMLCRCSR